MDKKYLFNLVSYYRRPIFIGVLILVCAMILSYTKLFSKHLYTKDLSSAAPSSSAPLSHRILFGGDVMLDRAIRTRMETHGVDFALDRLTSTFYTYDMVVANLEGTITTSPTRSVDTVVDDPNHFMFTFDPSVAPMLYRNNFQIVSLANNHSDDFGVDGVMQTKQYLSDAGISFFGNTGFEEQPRDRVFVRSGTSPGLAFVGYNQFVTDGLETALADIKYATTAAELVIVMPHWGPEYQPVANDDIINEAHQLIDAGADLIIGSHPHVVQQREEYHGKTIFYSLGNFVFDQYFDERFQKGLLVGVDIFSDGTMQFTEIPIKTESTGQTLLRK